MVSGSICFAHVTGKRGDAREAARERDVLAKDVERLHPDQRRRAVKVSASVLTTDPWQEACQILPDVNTLTRNAAEQAYRQSGVAPEDLDLFKIVDRNPANLPISTFGEKRSGANEAEQLPV